MMLFNRFLAQKSEKDRKLSQSEISRRSGISKTYINELFSLKLERKKRPSRDVLLRIGFAMRMSKEKFDMVLKASSYKELYPRNPRDIAIMVSVERGYTLEEANDYLEGKGFAPLGK